MATCAAQPAQAQVETAHERALAASNYFLTSENCIACHSTLHSDSGEDISIGYNWRSSMMANSARDPYWHAGVRRESMDHPAAQEAIEDKCSTCHMPMDRFSAAAEGGRGRVFANLDVPKSEAPFVFDGVSCTVCHQITPDNFGEKASFDGGFEIDKSRQPGQRVVYGPYDVDDGLQQVMHSAGTFVPQNGPHLRESELCGTCHTLFTQTLNANGEAIGEFAEQMPYVEWLHSAYRETDSCQDCHMPKVDTETPITSVLGEPRPQLSRHVFRGGNAFMLGILNRYRGELGVVALPQELDAGIRRTHEFLGTSTASVSIESARVDAGRLSFDVAVENMAGHKLSTAYPSRRVWLHVTVADSAGRVVFESGALNPNGSIVGNDNDADGGRFEPHYDVVERPDEVQIYEPIMVDEHDNVTTGLLSSMRYIKDNRLLPRGFDKAGAPDEVAVRGAAADDADFVAGGDRVAYRVALTSTGGPVTVTAELQYQAIGFRWAENLKAYDAPEPNRFVRYYEASAGNTAVRLAADSMTIDSRSAPASR